MHYLIKDLNPDEKPREKLIKHGVGILTDTELIALIVRSGGKENSAIELSRQIIERIGNIANLRTISINKLMEIKFVDVAKASSLIAAIELGVRAVTGNVSDGNTKITTPADVFKLLQNYFLGKTKEHLVALSLNSRNKLLARNVVSIGTLNETLLSPREIIKHALDNNAASIILVHNHPSQDPTPSAEDIVVTNKLQRACSEVGITLLDHVIICNNNYYSIKEKSGMQNNTEKSTD